MSNLEQTPVESVCGGVAVAPTPATQLLEGREVVLGGPRDMLVTRSLPHRDRRMVGAWCFVDQFGPDDIGAQPGMRVPPHPHTGLQTVSWLVAGEVLHRDSLGSHQLIQPGQLNLMTAGAGISHSEESPQPHSPTLHGVQLWVALPESARHAPPRFEHYDNLPVVRDGAATITVLMGEFAGVSSPARLHSPLVGIEVALDGTAGSVLPLRPDFEHAAINLAGDVTVDGAPVPYGSLLYLGRDRAELAVASAGPARLMLLGGEPFEEQLVMWWNFVGRSHDEIVAFRAEWERGVRFGTVVGFDGASLTAPALPATPLKPRGRVR
jgi:quercetin 2,3-dioxygenase